MRSAPQIVAGAKFLTYWLVNLTNDIIVIMLTSILITLAIMLCQHYLDIEWYIYFWYTFVFMLCGWFVFAFNYMIALFFVNPSQAYTFSLSIQACSVLCFCHIIEAFEKNYVTTAKSPYGTYFMVLPLFSFCSAVATIFYNGEFQRICRDEHIQFISITLEKCQAVPNCCNTLTVFSVVYGIVIEVIVMTVTICIYWWVILMNHYRDICNCSDIPEDDFNAQLNDHNRRHDDTKVFDSGEESAFLEQYEIRKMRNADRRQVPLICDRLGKNFGDKVAVDRLSLILDRLSCFGILGVSGSGVTTLFDLITGFQTYSYGRILIKGRNAIYNPNLVRKMMGYGRQEMVNLPEFKIKNVLEHACKLSSYPPQYINEICVNLAKVFGIFPYYHRHLSDLSVVIMNRLNCAVTVMGNPQIILHDMATAGIDSAGKREVWNVLKRMQSKGATILVSTTSLGDCERYCTRVGFMSQGRFCLIGTPWNLNKLYADYYFLKGKTESNMLGALSSAHYLHAAGLNKLTDFMHKNFPNSTLKEQHGNHFLFLLPVQSNSITHIFKTLLRKANYLNIEDFELKHSLLSESFTTFWDKEYGLQHSDDKSTIDLLT